MPGICSPKTRRGTPHKPQAIQVGAFSDIDSRVAKHECDIANSTVCDDGLPGQQRAHHTSSFVLPFLSHEQLRRSVVHRLRFVVHRFGKQMRMAEQQLLLGKRKQRCGVRRRRPAEPYRRRRNVRTYVSRGIHLLAYCSVVFALWRLLVRTYKLFSVADRVFVKADDSRVRTERTAQRIQPDEHVLVTAVKIVLMKMVVIDSLPHIIIDSLIMKVNNQHANTNVRA